LVTIVIPCKNEEKYIGHLLGDLFISEEIGGVRIIIADASTDNTRGVIEAYRGKLNIEIIDGGPVSIAKNNGATFAYTVVKNKSLSAIYEQIGYIDGDNNIKEMIKSL
jgi:glycosyltransferase involved in cell wall biosynthesis